MPYTIDSTLPVSVFRAAEAARGRFVYRAEGKPISNPEKRRGRVIYGLPIGEVVAAEAVVERVFKEAPDAEKAASDAKAAIGTDIRLAHGGKGRGEGEVVTALLYRDGEGNLRIANKDGIPVPGLALLKDAGRDVSNPEERSFAYGDVYFAADSKEAKRITSLYYSEEESKKKKK